MKAKQCVAMILAGGQGSRLGVLTKDIAKPAVPFGGKYRIIDFTLSNCAHSGIDTVGVLTQYQPLELNTYIGNGQPWDLDRKEGGVFVLPPYVSSEKGEWYKGTANAIYQNIGFISQYDPEYVVILSGDHIYKMDYSLMVGAHKENGADATIAVIEVPWEEASRFGIMNTDEDMRITEFEEKPEQPKSNLASMGVYVFTWSQLKKYLIADENNPKSDNDFGKNIIPQMLAGGLNLFAYRFDGYWKDVGTIQSLWEANMELLDEKTGVELSDPDWKIFSRNPALPPHYLSPESSIRNIYITEGCEVFGTVEHSVLFEGVEVEEGAVIRDSILMPGAHIGRNVRVEKAIIGPNCEICEGAYIGSSGEQANDEFCNTKICSGGITLVGANIVVDKNVEIKELAMVTRNVMNNSADIPKKPEQGSKKTSFATA